MPTSPDYQSLVRHLRRERRGSGGRWPSQHPDAPARAAFLPPVVAVAGAGERESLLSRIREATPGRRHVVVRTQDVPDWDAWLAAVTPRTADIVHVLWPADSPRRYAKLLEAIDRYRDYYVQHGGRIVHWVYPLDDHEFVEAMFWTQPTVYDLREGL